MKLQKIREKHKKLSESGYTLMEGLVAMIMVAALMSAVAPIIAYSVGTRVQARKVELAAQAARSYIDAVRLGKLDPPPSLASDQEISADALTTCPQTQGGLLQYCPDPFNDFYCVDNDNDDDDDAQCTPDSLTDMMVYGAIDVLSLIHI